MKKILIDDIEIEVVKKDIKNLRLSVHPPDGTVKISAPKKITYESIELFTMSKLSWIKKQRAKFASRERLPEKQFVSGEEHYFFGTMYILNVIFKESNGSKIEIRDKEYIDLYVKEGSDKVKKEKIMREWYRKELKALIPPLIKKWEKIIGVKVEEWGVKKMKTRWGTCNIRDKRIWINLELAKKPLHCLEYIIVHELLHLIEPNHGKKFIALMDKYYPDWQTTKNELSCNYPK